MLFVNAVKKIVKRKKIDGFYEASYVLTPKEKQSLAIGFSAIAIPILIALLIIIIN
ncbi:MAG TPA: hypothetical protein VK071_02795 [Tissierellales bacterium]|nr:hypothetical protein [Tissierellales bacterium]